MRHSGPDPQRIAVRTVAGFMLRWSRMLVRLLTVLALLVAPLHMVWAHGASGDPDPASATALHDCMKHGAQSRPIGSDSDSSPHSSPHSSCHSAAASCLGCAACAVPPLPAPLLGGEPASNDRPSVVRIAVQGHPPTREIRPPRSLLV